MESGFHLQILQNRSDVNVVLHCQSIYATTIACMKKKPDNFNVSIEIPCYCGREIAIVPYYRPGSAELAKAVSEALLNHDAALLEKHGQVYAGKDLKSTIEKAEFLEMACVPASILIAHFFTVNRGKYIFWLFHFSVVMFIALLMIRIWNFL